MNFGAVALELHFIHQLVNQVDSPTVIGEDVLAIALTWLATRHPYAAGTLATIFVVIIVLLTRWVIRAMRALFRGAEHELTG